MREFVHTSWPGPDKRIITRTCPNGAGGKAVACNCIGACQPIIVDKDDPRTDDEIRQTPPERRKDWIR